MIQCLATYDISSEHDAGAHSRIIHEAAKLGFSNLAIDRHGNLSRLPNTTLIGCFPGLHHAEDAFIKASSNADTSVKKLMLFDGQNYRLTSKEDQVALRSILAMESSPLKSLLSVWPASPESQFHL